MENELIKVFTNREFGELRTVVKDGEPWFVATDVCDALGIGNSRMATDRLDPDERNTVSLTDGTPGNPNKAIVSESGLYTLILGSRKPSAHAFKRWVTHDVIPTIRKTGGYVANDNLFIDTYLPFADDNTKLLFRNTLGVIRKQNKLIEQQKPLVAFANQVTNSKDTIDIGQLAKVVHDEHINIGRNKLFQWLRSKKMLRDNNEPYQSYIDNGYFKVIETIKHTTYGDKIFTKTLVTGKAQAYIVERLRKEFGSN